MPAVARGAPEFEGKPPLDVLASWDAELKSLGVVREEYRRTRRKLKDHRRKAVHAQRRLRGLRSRLSALLAQGGASDRKEFVERAGWVERRQDCKALLEMANEDLRKAAAVEPELAIVEEDLERFDAEHNQKRIDALSAELEQIERDRHEAFEELGGVKQSLKSLEADCEASRLRFEESQTRHELRARPRNGLESSWRGRPWTAFARSSNGRASRRLWRWPRSIWSD